MSGGIGTYDTTGPLVGLAPGGATLTPGAEQVIIPGTDGRMKVYIAHAGADESGWIWLAMGQTAEEGSGIYLAPGGTFDEYVSGDVHAVLAADSPTDARVCWHPLASSGAQ